MVGDWHIYCRTHRGMSGLYPLDVSSMLSSRCDNQKCLQILPNVPQKAKLHLIANHWFRTAGGPKCSWLDLLNLCSQGACAHVVSRSVMSNFVTPRTIALQVPLSMGLSKQNAGVGCHFLLQGIFLTQGTDLCLLHYRWPPELQVDALPLKVPVVKPPGKTNHLVQLPYFTKLKPERLSCSRLWKYLWFRT